LDKQKKIDEKTFSKETPSSFLDRFLDKSILFSFDETGYKRHSKSFRPIESETAAGKHILITGGSSGIGLELTSHFLELGSTVVALSRHTSPEVINLQKLYGERLICIECDLADYRFIYKIIDRLPKIDVVINNAGGMPPYQIIDGNICENIFASQVLGHYCLLKLLIENHKLPEYSRVIFVASGGLYLQRLDLTDLTFTSAPYNKYKAYANAKRAQVILTEILASKYQNLNFYCCHPGWVDTPGVSDSMPWFYFLMKHRLRTPKEGADTIQWLALTNEKLSSGYFYFDRKIAPPHLLKKTEETALDRENLYKLCNEAYDAMVQNM
jgi:dehydrogenase/reductase SDR family protein 12